MNKSPLLFVLRQLGEISFIVSCVIHEHKTVFRNLLQIAVFKQVFVVFHRSLLPNAETAPPMPAQRMVFSNKFFLASLGAPYACAADGKLIFLYGC